MRQRFNILVLILSSMCGENKALLIICPIQSQHKTWWWQHHPMGCFSTAGTGRLVAIERKVNAAKCRDILDPGALISICLFNVKV